MEGRGGHLWRVEIPPVLSSQDVPEGGIQEGEPQELNPGAGITGYLEGGKSGGRRERETGSLGHASVGLFLLPCPREAPALTLRREMGKVRSEVALKRGTWQVVREDFAQMWSVSAGLAVWPTGRQPDSLLLQTTSGGPLAGLPGPQATAPRSLPGASPVPLVLLCRSI